MKDLDRAIELSNMMIEIGKLADKQTIAVITNMEEPLGRTVGNSLEVIEVIKALNGKMEDDVKEVVLTLGAYMLKLAGRGNNIEENKQKMLDNINNGKAFEKLKELVENQGGDSSYLEDVEKFPKAKYILELKMEESKAKYVSRLNAQKVGELSAYLGAGRIAKEDNIDMATGIVLEKKVGDKVEYGDIIAYIYANDQNKGKQAVEKLKQIYEYKQEPVKKEECILKIIE